MDRVRRVVAWWRALSTWVKDGLLAAVMLGGGVVVQVRHGNPDNPLVRDPDVWAVLLLVVATVPIAARRRYPLPVLVLVALGAVVLLMCNYPDTTGGFGALTATYTVASLCARRQSLVGAALVLAALLTLFLSDPPEDGFGAEQLVSNIVLFGIAWVIGDNVRIRRLRTAELEERAARLERERDEEARRAVAEERARIARELHDVVAHSMSVMTVQAGAARRVLDRDPDRAREALTAIEATGREGLAEMRRLLGVLRDEAGRSAPARRQPLPGLDRIGDLVAQVRDAGLEVELVVDGDATAPVPQGVDVSAYRIVQEALTNVMKHAGPARARVVVRRTPEAVEVEVVDDGRGASAHGGRPGTTGHGLVGMRERVALFGGTLRAGPRPGGGFQVAAMLPLEGAAVAVGDG